MEGAAGVLQAGLEAVAAEPSFHFDMNAELSVDAQGTSLDIPLTISGDFLAPDRFQGTMELKIFFFTIETEIITIGDTTWTKDPETGVLMFSENVLPNWSAKMSDYGDIDVDSEGAGKTSSAQQLTGRAHDPGPGGNPHGSERTPHQAHPGGL